MRWNKLPKRGLQLRMMAVFVTVACFAALFETFLLNRALIEVADSLPNDRDLVLDQLEGTFLSCLAWMALVLVPAVLVVGLLVTFRVAGPAYRIEVWLRGVAAGEIAPGDRCTLRGRDELGELCEAANDAVMAVHTRATTRAGPGSAGDSPTEEGAVRHESAATQPAGAANAGFAIIIALVTLVVLSATILTAVTSFRTHSGHVERHGEDYELESAAATATDVALHALWSAYREEVLAGTEADSVTGVRSHLDRIGCADQSAATTPIDFDLGAYVGLDTDGDGELDLGGVRLASLLMRRIDRDDQTELIVTTTTIGRDQRALEGSSWRRSVSTTFMLEPDAWGGLEYVLLANNVNCAVCHLEVDSAERVYGVGSAPFPRVKLGTLEQLQMRGDADSRIAGTLHAAGSITDEHGAPITNWRSETLRGVLLDADGNPVVDASGALTTTSFVPSDGSSDPGGMLYEDYSATSMVDGALPADFPPPFSDDGGLDPSTGAPSSTGAGNRRVDPGEFYAATKGFRGTISGGRIYVVPPTATINSSTALAAALTNQNQTVIDRSISGQVFLTGTPSDPILLSGDVAIDGNLVLRGWVKGSGAIWVAESAFVPVDVKYLDGVDGSGDRTFGRAADGTENLLVLTAGGNVVLGDPYQPYRVGTSLEGRKPSFANMEMSIFNRSEWAKTQPTLPGISGPVVNPGHVPGYMPRYYVMSSGEQIGIFNRSGGHFEVAGGSSSAVVWRGPEHPTNWGTGTMTFADPGDFSDPLLYDAAGQPTARVLYLTAGNTWISDALLRQLVDDSHVGRPNGPLKLDLFAYTNNAIFGIVDDTVRNHAGELQINGGVVAADVGLLATDGIKLNYDGRVRDVLRIQGSESVVVRRVSQRVLQ